jgi:hypothetical protein
MSLGPIKDSVRLVVLANVLLLFGNLAALSEPLDLILVLLAAGLLLGSCGLYLWEERREPQADPPRSAAGSSMVRSFLSWTLPPALALGLLSLGTLAPISDLWDKVFSWIAIAILLAYVGVPVWEYHRARQADRSSSAATSSSGQV